MESIREGLICRSLQKISAASCALQNWKRFSNNKRKLASFPTVAHSLLVVECKVKEGFYDESLCI